ncbi:processed acidic surface protein [Bacillus sp. PS06]|uniref:processed acidic surface protein n=1 Tax=Bacillus sp. PS06 TaxID=2764176 RepID=UPI0017812947|nr:processed acidic surface protein [Bacillus sp. PS06]MBD8071179.1 processed acidic surface protein [Bacillus sp. PS06]
MRKLLSVLLIVMLSFSVLPTVGLAAPSDAELESYLTEIGLTKEELVEYLDYYGLTIEDFVDVEEVRIFIGPVLTEENLQEILLEYEITLEELEALLVEYGEIEEGQAVFDVYYFYDDLYWTVSSYLDMYGTPITPENLQELLDKYELTHQELVELFEANDDSIEYYEYIEDLDLMTEYYLYYPEFDIDTILSEIGLTDDELDALINHLMSTLDYEDPAFEAKLLELSDRLESFDYFDTIDELTAEQIAELAYIFSELLDLFQLDVDYYLVNGDEKKPLNLQTLITMTELKGADLLIEFFNKEGLFLADILITGEKFDSDLIEEVGKDVKEVDKMVKETPKPPVTKTVKGGKLPNTASDYPINTLIGGLVAGLGIILFRRWKKHYAA